MWRRIIHFFRKPTQSDNLLAEFEDTLMLIVDPEQLTNNLLSKLKELISQAMPKGGTLSIKTHQLTEGGPNYTSGFNRLLIQVEDEGAGIVSDLHDKVFEPFFTTKAGGTGLGLAICNSIVKRYNGEIWVKKAKSGGTEVNIALPVS